MMTASPSSRISKVHHHLLGGPNPAPTAVTPGTTLKVGIVGLGGRGTSTLGTMEQSERLQAKMTIVAIADVDAAALDPQKDKGYAQFSTATELIQSGLIDTLIISTPHYCPRRLHPCLTPTMRSKLLLAQLTPCPRLCPHTPPLIFTLPMAQTTPRSASKLSRLACMS